MCADRRSYRRGFGLGVVLWGVAVICASWCHGAFAKEINPAGTAASDLEFPILKLPSPELPPPPAAAVVAEQRFVLEDSALDLFGQHYEEFKQRYHVPVTVGVWNWWHVNTGGPLASGYGIPSTTNSAYPPLPGTYNYSLEASPECACSLGPFTKMGVYTDVRFRDSGVPLRPFYPNDTCWLQQGYVWASSDFGVLKAGAIARRFGLDWDGSWWGNVAYFDGFMLADEWGVSWEATTEVSQGSQSRPFPAVLHPRLPGRLAGGR